MIYCRESSCFIECNISNNIFLPVCQTPSNYAGKSIYQFTSISTCPSSLSFNNICPITTTTFRPTTNITAFTTTKFAPTTTTVGTNTLAAKLLLTIIKLIKRFLNFFVEMQWICSSTPLEIYDKFLINFLKTNQKFKIII